MKKLLWLVVLIPALSLQSCAWIAPARQVEGQVTMTERTGGEDSHYRFSVQETSGISEMFTNVDALEIGKFNSGTLQARLASAQASQEVVCLEVYGWRVPWLSAFENVRSFCGE